MNLENYIRQCLIENNYTLADKKVAWDKFIGKSGDLRDLNKVCEARNIQCLSTTYWNNSTKLTFQCKICNHVWKTSPGSIKSGTGCSKCADQMVSIKNTRYDHQKILDLRKQGKHHQKIANEIGCSRALVYWVCAKNKDLVG